MYESHRSKSPLAVPFTSPGMGAPRGWAEYL